MRTTIDLPDDLFRRVKARAALDGVKLKDLITRYVEQGLQQRERIPAAGEPGARPHRSPPVIARAATGRPIAAVSREELMRMEHDEDVERHDRSAGR